MTFREALNRELRDLPGPDYQQTLAPENRPLVADSSQNSIAAVSLLILKTENDYRFLLIKRPQYNGPHSGQVSFPGGKAEEMDQSLVDTAIRETYEEIGLQLSNDELLGPLTSLQIPVSNFHVHPFVFFHESAETFRTDPKEVDYVFSCTLMNLLDPDTLQQTTLRIRGISIDTPYFSINTEVVWGATAMMLAEFKEILLRITKKNPGLI